MINGAMLTCEEAQAAGGAGLIASDSCSIIQDEATDTCGRFDEPAPVCDICDGSPIQNPNGVIMINGSMLTCEEAQNIGNAGLISPDTCSIVQAEAISPCDCTDEVPTEPCDICGPDSVIGTPNGIIFIDGDSITYSEAQVLADSDGVTDDTCSSLQDSNSACSCIDEDRPDEPCDICEPPSVIGRPNGRIDFNGDMVICAFAQAFANSKASQLIHVRRCRTPTVPAVVSMKTPTLTQVYPLSHPPTYLLIDPLSHPPRDPLLHPPGDLLIYLLTDLLTDPLSDPPRDQLLDPLLDPPRDPLLDPLLVPLSDPPRDRLTDPPTGPR
jgi:hypothetical protein